VAVTASADYQVVDRRRIELVEPAMATAPIRHEGKPLDDGECAELVARVGASGGGRHVGIARRSGVRAARTDRLRVAPSLALDFPRDITVQRRAPYESHADSVMYRQVLADVARARGWDVLVFDAKSVEQQAAGILGERTDEVLSGPRARLGPPWAKDHRIALAATIVGGANATAP
jgi:hypothetical protein